MRKEEGTKDLGDEKNFRIKSFVFPVIFKMPIEYAVKGGKGLQEGLHVDGSH